MAIAEMRKLNLAAMAYDRDKILNALQRTGAAEVKTLSLHENLTPVAADCDDMRAYLASAEAALEVLSVQIDNRDKEQKIKSDILKDGFDVTYTEFMSARDKKEEADGLIARINFLTDEKNRLLNELSRCERTIQTAVIYSAVGLPFSAFSDTAHAALRLGTIPAAEYENLSAAIAEIALAEVSRLSADSECVLILVTAHKSAIAETEGVLSAYSFSPCPFTGDISGAKLYSDALAEKDRLISGLMKNSDDTYALRDKIRPLKVYCDYIGFELEKAELSDKMLATQRTFFMEAYVPAGSEELISQELNAAVGAVFYEFSEVPEDEMPPTLMKNNPAVGSFETITNMYSPPNAREMDPTLIMAFFYSVFLGFIMGDIGYGLVMLLGGGLIFFKCKRDGGFKRLSGVFAIGGIFAIIWGVLFNSLFGVSLPFLPTLMPDAQSDMWSLAGISVPAVFLISLIIGTVQLFAGYICRTVQCWRRGQIADGICDGVIWALFSVGVAFALIGFTEEAGVPVLAQIGGILAGVSLVAAMLTAGRKEKLLGKFTKGFGAAYGVINYASDILSYARLYGLMLSGAVIAQIVSQYAIDFITGGNVIFAILGVILMVIGHAFNLAIGLLGAYIHDARLQYVEFYGRFFEGEGELFKPLGSQHKYVYINN